MKFHVFAGAFKVAELNKEVNTLIKYGFQPIGNVQQKSFEGVNQQQVIYYQQKLNREVYEGMSILQSYNHWKALNTEIA